MNKRKGIQLLYKYLQGKLDTAEKARIDKWYDAADSGSESALPDDETLDDKGELIFQRIQEQLNEGGKVVPFYKRTNFKVAVAAAIVLALVGLMWPGNDKKAHESLAVQHNTPVNKILPPTSNKAMLTLADGTTVPFDSLDKKGNLVQGNVAIAKKGDRLVYDGQTDNNAPVMYNTLSVPRGSQPVHLVLSDGTQAWLNVASSITYPAFFTGNERKVTITGEVYFEVAHDNSKRFLVDANGSEVQVFGTHFNVMAYNDEDYLNTTLLEGSVKVVRGNASKMLEPGQQAKITSGGAIHISEADVAETMSWKTGEFVFKSYDIKQIMRQVARWYDVEVTYQSTMPDKHFSGVVNRNNEINQVLKILEGSGFKFTISGRKVLVSL